MSRFTVNLNEPQEEEKTVAFDKETIDSDVGEKETAGKNASETGDVQPPKRRSKFLRFLSWFGIVLAVILLVGAVGGFFYWRSVKQTPAYSLALLVDAARRDDKVQIEKLVDTEAVINDFMPQVTAKAIELYGRNMTPETIAKVEEAARPLIPAVKERARSELPRVIREKTAPAENVPYWLIALGANRAVDIKIEGDKATVKSKIPEHQLELTMKRDGELWKVVGMKDDVLAQKIAERIGQDMIAFATKNGVKKAGEQFGVKNADELLKSVQNIFK